MTRKVWIGKIAENDDFGDKLADEFIDGRTRRGPWAIMSPRSWQQHGCGRLGMGCGQRYKRDGMDCIKIEG